MVKKSFNRFRFLITQFESYYFMILQCVIHFLIRFLYDKCDNCRLAVVKYHQLLHVFQCKFVYLEFSQGLVLPTKTTSNKIQTNASTDISKVLSSFHCLNRTVKVLSRHLHLLAYKCVCCGLSCVFAGISIMSLIFLIVFFSFVHIF